MIGIKIRSNILLFKFAENSLDKTTYGKSIDEYKKINYKTECKLKFLKVHKI